MEAKSDMHSAALLVCGNDFIAQRLGSCVRKNNYTVLNASGAAEALRLLGSEPVSFLFTDLEPEDMDGYELCRTIREKTKLPLIVVTQKDDIVDKVLALELGADDFVSFPFDERELSARIKAVRRRYHPTDAAAEPLPETAAGYASSAAELPAEAEDEKRPRPEAGGTDHKTLVFPGLTISLSGYVVICNGKTLPMPPRELELLFFLASAPNQVFTREQLLDQVWGYDYVGDTRTVDVHIKRLRSKLKNYSGAVISTVWRVGYKFTLTPGT